jgi:hypothetical protein
MPLRYVLSVDLRNLLTTSISTSKSVMALAVGVSGVMRVIGPPVIDNKEHSHWKRGSLTPLGEPGSAAKSVTYPAQLLLTMWLSQACALT